MLDYLRSFFDTPEIVKFTCGAVIVGLVIIIQKLELILAALKSPRK